MRATRAQQYLLSNMKRRCQEQGTDCVKHPSGSRIQEAGHEDAHIVRKDVDF